MTPLKEEDKVDDTGVGLRWQRERLLALLLHESAEARDDDRYSDPAEEEVKKRGSTARTYGRSLPTATRADPSRMALLLFSEQERFYNVQQFHVRKHLPIDRCSGAGYALAITTVIQVAEPVAERIA